ncbi:hypothetical protein NL676_036712 [Syzygium grande]|nr:hypothetical protein NL676_036712 [Syzygium grande]
MTQKSNLFKGQQKKKTIPPSRHGKAPPTRKGKRNVKPLKVTKDMEMDREISKFINHCNEVKAATAANKEGGQLSIVKPPPESTAGKRNSIKSGDIFECQKADLELPLFDLVTVAVATNKFSTENKVGDGGFDPVYKGCSEDRPSVSGVVMMPGSDMESLAVGAEALRLGITGPWITKSYLEMILERKGVPRHNTPPPLSSVPVTRNQERTVVTTKPIRDFTYKIDPSGFPEILLRQGSEVKFRSGPWNGVRFSGRPDLDPNRYYSFEFVLDDDEIYYHFDLLDSSFISRLVLDSNGNFQRFSWIVRTQNWKLYHSVPIDNCDSYAFCGAHGSCKINESPVCGCLKGFTPKYSQQWDNLDWSNGCVRRTPLDCRTDIFVKYSGVKLPDTSNSWFNKTMSLQECQEVCKKNCSCVSYSNLDIREGGSGCLLWFGELIDIRELNQNGQELFIRMAASESDLLQSKQKKHKLFVGLAISLAVVSPCLVLTFCILQNKRKKMKHLEGKDESFESGENSGCQKEDLELPVFDLGTIAIATNNFSEENKLGEGGFGPVYKAWRLFTVNRSLELLDEFVASYKTAEVLRSIHVALLCVQQCPEDRPSMSAVIMMLGSDNELPPPKEPGFFSERKLVQEHTSSQLSHSSNEITMTLLSPR